MVPASPIALVDDLRSRRDLLAREIRLVPLHERVPLPWESDRAIVGLLQLERDARSTALDAMVTSSDSVLHAVALHLIIEGQHPERLEEALALERTPLVETFQLAAIGRLGAQQHFDRVRAALDVPELFWGAVEALALLGGERALTPLRAALSIPTNPWDRLDVLSTIHSVNAPLSVPLLIEALGDAERFDTTRGFAAQALGASKDPRALQPLLTALDDPTVNEKGRVLWGLGQLENPRVFDAVRPYLDHAEKDWWQGEALKAAAASDPERAWPHVERAAIAPHPYFGVDYESYSDAIHALGRTHHDASRTLLLTLLEACLGGARADWVPSFVQGLRPAVTLATALSQTLDVPLFSKRGEPGFRYADLVRALLEQLSQAIPTGSPHREALERTVQAFEETHGQT